MKNIWETNPEELPGGEGDKQTKSGVVSTLLSYVPYLLLGIILAMGFRAIIVPSVVVGESMEGSFEDGDYLLVNKMAYLNKSPERGDVVVLDSEEVPGSSTFIKRIVALPGDEVEILEGVLYLNGKEIKEPYAKERMESEDISLTVPQGEVFLLGDNRNHSMDSRMFGSVDIQKEVIGKVFTRLMPFNQDYRADYYES